MIYFAMQHFLPIRLSRSPFSLVKDTVMNRSSFYSAIRISLFGGRLGQAQVAGIDAMLDAWDGWPAPADSRYLAYMLATAFHETSGTMRPVRETLADSDDEAIARLDLAWRKGRLNQVRTPYWRRDAEGKSWLGRGLVQLTHKANYAKLSGPAGVDLLAHPEMAMEMGTAVRILFAGMRDGLFTGHRLSDVFNPLRQDWTGARRIINGTDRAALVAGHAKRFDAALTAALANPVAAHQGAC